MKAFDNIGLGFFFLSIVSVVFWSPRPSSISLGLDDAIDKVSQKGQFFIEKAKNIPFKTDFAIRDTIDKTKIDVEDSKDLYSNSLTQANEENVQPTLNEISNWVGVDQDPSIIQKHLNKPKENSCEIRIASKEIGKGNIDASYITSNDLKDTSHSPNVELYKQAKKNYDQSNDWIADHDRKVFDKSNLATTFATTTIEKVDNWVADHAHEVFDKSGLIVDVAENEVGKVMDATFQEMDVEKNSKSPNNSVSNIVGSLQQNTFEEDANESNIWHKKLQLLGTNNIEDDVRITINIVHTNEQLLGNDDSSDFITKNEHKNSQELNKQWNQMSKVKGPNLIQPSFIRVNNLWSTYVEDSKINEAKNEFNSQKELHDFGNVQESIHDQNENLDEDSKQYHPQVRSQQYRHFEGGYDDDTNYDGVKGRIVKYLDRTYEDAKGGATVDYKGGKYIQRARNRAHHHYRDGRHKASEVYKPIEDTMRNFRKRNHYNKYYGDDDDEDFYDDDNKDLYKYS